MKSLYNIPLPIRDKNGHPIPLDSDNQYPDSGGMRH